MKEGGNEGNVIGRAEVREEEGKRELAKGRCREAEFGDRHYMVAQERLEWVGH